MASGNKAMGGLCWGSKDQQSLSFWLILLNYRTSRSVELYHKVLSDTVLLNFSFNSLSHLGPETQATMVLEMGWFEWQMCSICDNCFLKPGSVTRWFCHVSSLLPLGWIFFQEKPISTSPLLGLAQTCQNTPWSKLGPPTTAGSNRLCAAFSLIISGLD